MPGLEIGKSNVSEHPRRPNWPASSDIRGWDVRTPDEQPAKTVHTLALALGISVDNAREWVHRHKAHRNLPSELVEDADKQT